MASQLFSLLRLTTIALTLIEQFEPILAGIPDKASKNEVPNTNEPDDLDFVEIIYIHKPLNLGPPVFTKEAQMQKLIPFGSTVRLNCPANGNPVPNITWTKDEENIDGSMDWVKYTKWSIELEHLVPEDSGKYTCHVCNSYGCVNITTKVVVMDLKQLEPITVLVGTNFSMKCKAWSNSSLSTKWFKSKGICRRCPTIKDRKFDPDNPMVLTFENVTHADEGWYTCVSSNHKGQLFGVQYLRVDDDDLMFLPVPQPSTPTTQMTIIIVVFSACSTVLVVIVIIVCKKLSRERMKRRVAEQWANRILLTRPMVESSNLGLTQYMQMPIVRFEMQRPSMEQCGNCDPAVIPAIQVPIDLNWEFPRNKLILGKHLGEGAFGKVLMAEANGLVKGQTSTVVAVKMLKEEHTDSDVKDLVSEMEMMKMIGKHDNIINLLGCCCKDGPLYVIVEYALHGNLKKILRSHRIVIDDEKKQKILTQKELISFAHQIACGMEYLASRKCIHRDLAARNVLVSNGYVMKIADFGMARDIRSRDYYRKKTNGKLPIRWMAPESLEEMFYDSRSDVWSFGVLLWEIMTLGGDPFSSISNWDELLKYLKKGKRLRQPPLCSMDIYLLMHKCWYYRPEQRPTFSEIVHHLDRLENITSNEEYLNLGIAHNLDNDGCVWVPLDTFNHHNEAGNSDPPDRLLSCSSDSEAFWTENENYCRSC